MSGMNWSPDVSSCMSHCGPPTSSFTSCVTKCMLPSPDSLRRWHVRDWWVSKSFHAPKITASNVSKYRGSLVLKSSVNSRYPTDSCSFTVVPNTQRYTFSSFWANGNKFHTARHGDVLFVRTQHNHVGSMGKRKLHRTCSSSGVLVSFVNNRHRESTHRSVWSRAEAIGNNSQFVCHELGVVLRQKMCSHNYISRAEKV